MPLSPEAQAFLDERARLGSKEVETLTPEEARAQSLRFAQMTQGEEVARVEELEIPGPGGVIPARLYAPKAEMPLPVLVYFHGGGWVTGSCDTTDVPCRALANATGCIVVSVNYRHAPENRFPAAAEDAYAATKWVVEHAAELGGDPARVAIVGSSAGGNLAAVTALMARDRGGPKLAFQCLMVPATNHSFDTVSYRDNADGYLLTRRGMQWFWGHYLGSADKGTHPYASPLLAESHADLPPALVVTAEFDPLRDEGTAYAEQLRAAGVRVEHHQYAGMIHPFLGSEAARETAETLRRELKVQ